MVCETNPKTEITFTKIKNKNHSQKPFFWSDVFNHVLLWMTKTSYFYSILYKLAVALLIFLDQIVQNFNLKKNNYKKNKIRFRRHKYCYYLQNRLLKQQNILLKSAIEVLLKNCVVKPEVCGFKTMQRTLICSF